MLPTIKVLHYGLLNAAVNLLAFLCLFLPKIVNKIQFFNGMCLVDASDDKDSWFLLFSICILYSLATNLFLCISLFVFIFQLSEHLLTSHFFFFYCWILIYCFCVAVFRCLLIFWVFRTARVFLLYCSCVDCVL